MISWVLSNWFDAYEFVSSLDFTPSRPLGYPNSFYCSTFCFSYYLPGFKVDFFEFLFKVESYLIVNSDGCLSFPSSIFVVIDFVVVRTTFVDLAAYADSEVLSSNESVFAILF